MMGGSLKEGNCLFSAFLGLQPDIQTNRQTGEVESVKQSSICRFLTSFGVVVGVSLCSRNAQADPITLNSTFDYSENYSEEEVGRILQQTHQVGLNNELALTDTISIVPSVRIQQESDNQNTENQNTYSYEPNVEVSWRSQLDLVSLNSSYTTRTRYENEDPKKASNDSWDVRASSNFKPVWPKLELRYGQNVSKTDGETTASSKNLNMDFSKQYSISVLNLSYRFTRGMNWDNIAESVNTNDSHDAILDMNKTLFGGMLDVAFSEQVSYTTRLYEFGAGAGSIFDVPITGLSKGYYAIDTSPETNDAATLVQVNDLFSGGAQIDISTKEYMNILFSVTGADASNLIVLYLDKNLPTDVSPLDFQFAVWESDDPDVETATYHQVGTATAQYFEEEFGNGRPARFELTTPTQTLLHRKVVVTAIPQNWPLGGDPANVTKLEAYDRQVATGSEEKSSTTSYKTSFNMTFRPAKNWRFNTAFFHDVQTGEPDVNKKTDMSENVGLYWTPTRYFRPSVTMTQSLMREETDPVDTSLSRNVTTRISSSPLTTTELTLGINRSQNYDQEILTTEGESLYLSATSQIFPDLSAALTGTSSTTTNVIDGTTSDSFNSTLTANMRVSPRVTIDGSAGYQMSQDGENNLNNQLSVSWRPSDIFTCTADYTSGQTTSYSFRPSWRPSRELQVSAGYSQDDEEQTLSMQTKWLVSDYFSLSMNYYWQDVRWSWNTRLTADF